MVGLILIILPTYCRLVYKQNLVTSTICSIRKAEYVIIVKIMKDRVSDLKDRVSDLKDRVGDLKDRVSHLKDRVSHL